MIPLWLPVAVVLLVAWFAFLGALGRHGYPHARTLPRPRPHRVFMTGRHVRRSRHAA